MQKTVFRTPVQANSFTRPEAEGGSRRDDYFWKTSGLEFGPEGFLVDIAEHREVRAHFHPVDQFQVMFGRGGATYKKDLIPQVLVHYSDRNTTYGPFAAAQTRLRFFTLRAEPTAETHFMPEARGRLPAATARRRHFLHDLDPYLAGPLPPPGQSGLTYLFGTGPGTPSASLLWAGPDAAVTLPDAAAPGRYCLVIAGGLINDQRQEFGPCSLGWTDTSGATGAQWTGGSGLRSSAIGLHALLLQFPSGADQAVPAVGRTAP
jgi:hypothetical protein